MKSLILKKYLNYLPYFIITIVVLILFNNLFYTFCWSDEGFYISTLERIRQGQKLFIDDWSPTQAYCPIIYPFYCIYLKLFKTTDSIYLASRIVHLIVQFVISLFIYNELTGEDKQFQATCASLLFLLFSRANIYGFSYYALTLEFVICSILCKNHFSKNNNFIFIGISGFFMALAVLCNPYLTIFYFLISFICVIYFIRIKKIKMIIPFFIGTIIPAIFYIIFFFPFNDLDTLRTSLYYIFNDPEYTHVSLLKQTYSFFRQIVSVYKYSLILLSFLSFFYILFSRKINSSLKKYIQIGFYFINIFCCFVNLIKYHRSDLTLYPYIIFTFYNVIIFFETMKVNRKYIFNFIIPGFCLALSYKYASNTGLSAVSIGFCVISIGSVFINRDISKSNIFINKAMSFVIILILSLNLFYRINRPYRDIKISNHLLFIPKQHNELCLIKQGPAKGLYTSIKNENDYCMIYETIKKLDSDGNKSLFVSKLVPWAYIVNPKLVINTPTTWRTSICDYRLEPYFSDFSRNLPDYILIVNENVYLNDKNPVDNSWLYEICNNDYKKEFLECGIIFSKMLE